MLGIKLDVRPFLERVTQELGRIDPGQVRALGRLGYSDWGDVVTFICA